jgi:hypothetical protein
VDMMNDPRKLMIVPATGGPAKEILRTKAGESIPWITWTVDGSSIWLAATYWPDSEGKPAFEFLSISPDGQNVRELDMSLKNFGGFRFHPDGRRIAYWSAQGKLELWALENFLPVKK